MTMTLFKGYIIGNVGKVELKYTPDGEKKLCEFSIAHNWGRGDDKHTVWVNGTTWEKQAEMFNDFVQAGTLLFVEGDIELQQWQKDGVQNSKLVIKPFTWRVLAKGKPRDDSENPYGEPA